MAIPVLRVAHRRGDGWQCCLVRDALYRTASPVASPDHPAERSGADPSVRGTLRAGANQSGRTYDIAPDGKQSLTITAAGGADQTVAPTSHIVAQNWLEEWKRFMATP